MFQFIEKSMSDWLLHSDLMLDLMKELYYVFLDSPLGTMIIVVGGEHLCSLDYAEYEQRTMTLLQRRYGSVHLTQITDPCGINRRIRAYLAGDYRCLDDIAVKTGGTAFQQLVWSALRTIPAGTTTTYGALAARLGKPTRSTRWRLCFPVIASWERTLL